MVEGFDRLWAKINEYLKSNIKSEAEDLLLVKENLERIFSICRSDKFMEAIS